MIIDIGRFDSPATTNATPQEELGIPNYEFHDPMGKWRVTQFRVIHRANWQSRLLDKSRTVRDATIYQR